MWRTYLTAIAGIALLTAGWAVVQTAWRRVFAPDCPDRDVLAGRGGCRGGGCAHDCDGRYDGRANAIEEERR
ncbi:MAG TPA: hypothetical protein VD788_02710 [Candidatus Polarisedimenticolaceae bacterium]|nr:hypothetical protein [Candidatus Polarisedimenticolaceae bacterium]